MSDIFGTNISKFIGTGTPDSNTVTLNYSIVDPKFSEKVFKVFESPVSSSGQRTYKNKGRYATFYVVVYLFNYDINPRNYANLPSAKTMANTLLTYENQDVRFYPFNNEIKNSANANVHCRLIDLEFDFMEKIGSKHDIVTLTFMTNEFYDLSKLIIT